MPRIRDTEAQVAALEGLGVKAEWGIGNDLRLQADSVTDTAPDEELSARIRASFLLAGPLLARFGEAQMPPPGGDFIGRRRLDPHLDAFNDMGARIDGARTIEITAPERRPQALRDLHGRAVGDGHRERADGCGAHARADDDLRTPPREPHVQDLARLLVKMGAQIDGIGSNVDDRARARQARRRRAPRSAPTTSRSPASWRSPPRPGASCGSATPSPTT